jgi:non-canonical (house-cleaning) NTP pyrophosphatase
MLGALTHPQCRVVYVGSKNPVKVAAVTQALRNAFPGQQLKVQGTVQQ